LKGVRHLKKVDPVLGRIITEVGSFKLTLDPMESVYESLATSIIYQQLNGKAAASILKRFRERFSRPGNFPSPKRVNEAGMQDMRTTGLSESKCLALKDLAKKTILKEIPSRKIVESFTDEELIEVLTAVRGIGPWTVQMMMIFTLGRPDVLPTGDFGVRRGFSLLYGKGEMPTPKELESHGEVWRPFRSIASWYLWRVTELERFKLLPKNVVD
jgi:3-methyladenine DNA glycosylase/8-oxoguanine DNA glycosylase